MINNPQLPSVDLSEYDAKKRIEESLKKLESTPESPTVSDTELNSLRMKEFILAKEEQLNSNDWMGLGSNRLPPKGLKETMEKMTSGQMLKLENMLMAEGNAYGDNYQKGLKLVNELTAMVKDPANPMSSAGLEEELTKFIKELQKEYSE